MLSLVTFVQNWLTARRRDECGAALLEYGFIVVGVAVVVAGAAAAFGGRLTALYAGAP